MKYLLILAFLCPAACGQAVWNGRTYNAPVCSWPNCPMCYTDVNSIQNQLNRQRGPVNYDVEAEAKAAAQAPCPLETVDASLRLLSPTPRDVFADIGCGDGRVLIRAVERYGCLAVGVEIDPEMAARARRNIISAERAGRIPQGVIHVVTADAAVFDPAEYEITMAFAYLYPETLGQLSGVLTTIPIVATPFHRIPNTRQQDVGEEIYLWIRESSTKMHDLWSPLGEADDVPLFLESRFDEPPAPPHVYTIRDLLLADYCADYCGPCRQFDREGAVELDRAGLRIWKINDEEQIRKVGKQAHKERLDRDQVQSYPTLRLQWYDHSESKWKIARRDGRTSNGLDTSTGHLQWKGNTPAEKIKKAVESLLRRLNAKPADTDNIFAVSQPF